MEDLKRPLFNTMPAHNMSSPDFRFLENPANYSLSRLFISKNGTAPELILGR